MPKVDAGFEEDFMGKTDTCNSFVLFHRFRFDRCYVILRSENLLLQCKRSLSQGDLPPFADGSESCDGDRLCHFHRWLYRAHIAGSRGVINLPSKDYIPESVKGQTMPRQR
jgi:hypothetical protein